MQSFEPAPNMRVEDPKQIKAFSDPLRVRLLVNLAEGEATNQQLADRLGEPQAKVLYHLRFLLDAGLIVLVDTRIKGGNVEKYYRAVARTYDIRPSPELLADIVSAELDTLARDVAASAALFPSGQRMLARVRKMSPEQAELFFDQLIALADEFWPLDAPDESGDDTHSYAFAALVFRNPRDGEDEGA